MPLKKDLTSGVIVRTPLDITDNDWGNLERVGSIRLNMRRQNALFKILYTYDGYFAAEEKAAEVKFVIKRAEQLQKTSKKLMHFFSAPPQGKERASHDQALLCRLACWVYSSWAWLPHLLESYLSK